jgi:hypothetical protein
MGELHLPEIVRLEQLPRSEDVHFMRPDSADIVEGKREVEEQKRRRIHAPKCTSPGWDGNLDPFLRR